MPAGINYRGGWWGGDGWGEGREEGVVVDDMMEVEVEYVSE